MSVTINLVFAALLVASATQGSMKWNLWKQKGAESGIVAVYDTRGECKAQAKNLTASGDGWRYNCRAR